MTKIKIINDPVYGFIEVPHGLTLSIIDHPWFQRLRRIKQGGFSNLVYPGATHTRYHHAMGAYHLGGRAVAALRKKGVPISAQEAEALQLALLLHDMGHGPFSHSLEGLLLPTEHEAITKMFLDRLNEQYDGKLALTIEMFSNQYERPFFYQLITGELDLDRMDYLARDSFYTGVSEGVIGYDRIIYMLNVVENRLVVEEKGLNSIEKFLLARKLMYAQVYHHKMVVASEEMLRLFFERLHEVVNTGMKIPDYPIVEFIRNKSAAVGADRLSQFARLDDSDVLLLLKSLINSDDRVIATTANGLINRQLFAYLSGTEQELRDLPKSIRHYIVSLPDELVRRGEMSSKTYAFERDEISILMKNGEVKTYGKINPQVDVRKDLKHYICFPKKSDQQTVKHNFW